MLEPDKSFDDSWKADAKSKWLLKDGEIIASYFIKKSKTPPLLATYLAPEVPLAVRNADASVQKYRCISLWVNVVGCTGDTFTVRLDSHNLTIAIVECDPNAQGRLSADGKWKRLVMPFANDRMETTITEVEYFNKVKIVVNGTAGRAGTIHVKGIRLHVATADEVGKQVADGPPGRSASVTLVR
jgi:hypothetical protein